MQVRNMQHHHISLTVNNIRPSRNKSFQLYFIKFLRKTAVGGGRTPLQTMEIFCKLGFVNLLPRSTFRIQSLSNYSQHLVLQDKSKLR